MTRKNGRSVKRLPALKDPFAAHEALDRAHLAVCFFSDHVAEHAYVRAGPKLTVMANKIAGLLADFYQAVGAVSFEREEKTTRRGTRS